MPYALQPFWAMPSSRSGTSSPPPTTRCLLPREESKAEKLRTRLAYTEFESLSFPLVIPQRGFSARGTCFCYHKPRTRAYKRAQERGPHGSQTRKRRAAKASVIIKGVIPKSPRFYQRAEGSPVAHRVRDQLYGAAPDLTFIRKSFWGAPNEMQ